MATLFIQVFHGLKNTPHAPLRFCSVWVGAKERKIYRLSPPDIGTFMHAVIEKFSKLVTKGDKTWRNFDGTWCKERISEIIDDMLEKCKGKA